METAAISRGPEPDEFSGFSNVLVAKGNSSLDDLAVLRKLRTLSLPIIIRGVAVIPRKSETFGRLIVENQRARIFGS
jgi:hypothetical protein